MAAMARVTEVSGFAFHDRSLYASLKRIYACKIAANVRDLVCYNVTEDGSVDEADFIANIDMVQESGVFIRHR